VNDGNEMQRLLAAEGPDPSLAGKLALFGQFVGSWDLEGWTVADDGTRTLFVGEWHFGWILEGRGIQDVLITRPATQAAGDRALGIGIGSTLRTYDPGHDRWFIAWEGPSDGEFSTLLAQEAGDRIVLNGRWSIVGGGDDGRDDRRFEWSFSEITDDSFHWEGRRSLDAGRTWRLGQVMLGRRRHPETRDPAG